MPYMLFYITWSHTNVYQGNTTIKCWLMMSLSYSLFSIYIDQSRCTSYIYIYIYIQQNRMALKFLSGKIMFPIPCKNIIYHFWKYISVKILKNVFYQGAITDKFKIDPPNTRADLYGSNLIKEKFYNKSFFFLLLLDGMTLHVPNCFEET